MSNIDNTKKQTSSPANAFCLGWFCKMLRDNQPKQQPGLRREDRAKKVDGQAEPEGENDPGDSDPSVPQSQECGGIL